VADFSSEDHPSTVGQTVPVGNNPSFQHLLTHKTALAVDDAQSDPRLAQVHDLMCHRGTVSLLLVPLLFKEQVLGSLCLNSLVRRHFSTEEVKLAQSVAEQVAGALTRVQLDEQHRQLEEQYRQSQKMEAIGRLAGGMAHDFNNLLTVITGYSELLLHRYVDRNTPEHRDIEQINKAGNRAKTLTRQLLAFSRQQVIQPEVLDLNTTITDINQMLRRLVSENIDLITILAPGLGRIKADPGQTEQIIMNLVVNACDAMPQGGKLTIKTTNVDLDEDYASRHIGLEPGSYVKLTIGDTGVGMDVETQTHIFEPFFTTKAKGKGTGLGLATVYGIVQQNEGYISVSSEPGQGTTFQIYLPRLEQAPELASRDQASAESSGGTETILLVEDEDMVRDLVRYALLQDGYNILEARHGQNAIEVCEKHEGPIHLLLTDVIMPGGLTGRELAERLISLYPGIKVLYMSGYTDDAIVHHGILDPDIAFLQKPFTPTTLSRKVREILDVPGDTPD
jgi:signal transduction histidine kinase